MKAIRVRFKGPTNSRPAYWIASDYDGNKARVTVGERDAEPSLELRGDELAAYKLCRKMGWNGRLHGGRLAPGEMAFVFEQDHPIEVE